MTENYETLLPEAFDPATQEGNVLVPVGWYDAQITDASVVQPQTGDGHYVGLTWQIIKGEHEGRYVFQNITFQHSSVQAVTIGRRQFKDLCVATGVNEQVTDVAVFKFIPCRIRVGIEIDKKQGLYPDKNRVSRILPLEQPKDPERAKAAPTSKPPTPAASAATTTTTKPAATSANGGVPPWRQSKPTVAEEIDDEIPHR